MTKHSYYDNEHGLAHCKICNGAEGSLPTDCPGRQMTDAEEQEVYRGALDFRDGRWHGKRPSAEADEHSNFGLM